MVAWVGSPVLIHSVKLRMRTRVEKKLFETHVDKLYCHLCREVQQLTNVNITNRLQIRFHETFRIYDLD